MAAAGVGLQASVESPILPDGLNPCGKWWYRTKAEAETQMARQKPDPNRGPGWELNVYYCQGCQGWHIGHTRVTQ